MKSGRIFKEVLFMKTRFTRIGCLLLTVVMLMGLLPMLAASASATTLEEKQQAVIATAWAYYDKGRPVQYDSRGLSTVSIAKGGANRTTWECPPEYATPDETLFSVCSDFTYQVYFDVFGYRVCGDHVRNRTASMSKYEPGKDPICAYMYNSKTDSTPREEAIKKFCAQLQPGDIINTGKKVGGGGHAMLFVGDVLGDGKGYILHCGGKKYDTKTGSDIVECSPGKLETIEGRIIANASSSRNDGAILLAVAEEYLMKKYTKSKDRTFSAIRPLAVITDDIYPMSAAAKGRLQFPRLVYNRTASPYTRFNDVPEGGTVTIKVELKNCSNAAYTIPVKEVVPEGVTFVKASDGGQVSGKEITWNVAVGAGETKVVSYDCTVNLKRGETVVFTDSSAGGIPSNTLRIPVGGKHLTDAENALLLEMANGGHADLYAGSKKDAVPAVVWQKLLKLNVKLPTSKQLVGKVLEKFRYDGKVVYRENDEATGDALTWRKMLVPEFAGGFRYGKMDSRHRVVDTKCDYLYPGDVVIQIKKFNKAAEGQTIVYLGDRKFLGQGENGTTIVDWFELQKCHTYDLFFALRPTLAYDDVHTPETTVNKPIDTSLKFSDVKENDWFYKDVKDLVRDGTVSGMNATSFAPNGNVTWGQALKLIAAAVHALGYDRDGAHWANGWMRRAQVSKWLEGDVDLDKPITRLELCQVAAKAKGLTEQPEKNPFADTDDKDVLALNKVGIINGVTATEFKPNDLLTRAQISKIIVALRDYTPPKEKKSSKKTTETTTPAATETTAATEDESD